MVPAMYTGPKVDRQMNAVVAKVQSGSLANAEYRVEPKSFVTGGEKSLCSNNERQSQPMIR